MMLAAILDEMNEPRQALAAVHMADLLRIAAAGG